MEENILTQPKGTVINLGGKDYELPPFNLNTMVELEDQFNCSIENIKEAMESRRAGTIKKLLIVFLCPHYPELTPEKIGELVTLTNLAEVSTKVAQAIGG